MKPFSLRHGWAFLAAALSFIEPSISGAQATSLRVGTNSPASTEAVLFSIAKDAGILKQHQLDAEVIYIAGGTLSMQALVGRSLDFMCTGETPFIYAYLEGVQGKIIGGVNNRLPYGFVSLANIKTPAQLKNKRIGISRFGSTDDFAVKLALAQFGLNPKNDVSITQIGGAATRLTALQAGSIDAAIASYRASPSDAAAHELQQASEPRRMELLTSLRGVGVPMASAILTLIDPKLGTLDNRVVKQ